MKELVVLFIAFLFMALVYFKLSSEIKINGVALRMLLDDMTRSIERRAEILGALFQIDDRLSGKKKDEDADEEAIKKV